MTRSPPVKELRERFGDGLPTPEELAELRCDPRQGVAALVRSLERRLEKTAAWQARAAELDSFRRRLAARGFAAIGGIDEAGRGPLAGPVYAACVVLAPGWDLPGLDDSKKLRAGERERLEVRIQEQAQGWAVAWAEPAVIDEVNILEATRLAMAEAVRRCRPRPPDYLLLDAVRLEAVDLPQQAVVRGDSRVAEIAAASILAKVARDRVMKKLDEEYPGYGFAKHKGYGTAQHMQALAELGPCPAHRRSFAPVQRWVVPDLEELRARIRRAGRRTRLQEVGEQIREISFDLTPDELAELREAYRQRGRELS